VAEFVEVESGKRASRPKLDAAIAACKKHKAKLIGSDLSTALSRTAMASLSYIAARQ
jgi:hypothetical protein